MTAEWEKLIKQVEHGEMSDTAFMSGITELATELVRTNTTPNSEYMSLFASPDRLQGESVGLCPRCGLNVRESVKGFFCENKACQFALWKDNKFFTSKKKKLTNSVAAALLKDGRIHMTKLYSEKTGKTYNATIILDASGDKWVNFKLEFEQKNK